MEQKHCPRCKNWKDSSEFYRDKSFFGGLDVYCKSCRSQYGKEYQVAHHEKVIESKRAHRSAHHEEAIERESAYNVSHRENRRKYNKMYSAVHKEELTEYIRIYRAANPEKCAEYNRRRRANKTNVECEGITVGQWCNMKEEYGHLCAYCNQKKPLAMDHVVPLSKGGRHNIENVVPACRSCNSSKKDSSLLMFLYRRATETS